MSESENPFGADHTEAAAEDFFNKMLNSDNGTIGSHDEDEDETEDTAEPDEDEAQDEDDEASDEQADDEDDESDPEDDDSELSERELNRKVPIKNKDGHTEYVTVRELMASNMRQQDYTRKTTELSEQRRALEAQAQELSAVKQERAYYHEALSQFQAKLVSEYTPMTEEQNAFLRLHDPVQYALHETDRMKREQAYAQAEAQKRALEQRHAYEAQQAHEALRTSEMDKLLNAQPAWKDPKKFAEARNLILEHAQALGYSKAEVEGVSDSRAVLALYKSALADKVKAAKPVKTEIPRGPKTMPTQSASTRETRQSAEAKKARTRLANSGSTEDAAAALIKLGLI